MHSVLCVHKYSKEEGKGSKLGYWVLGSLGCGGFCIWCNKLLEAYKLFKNQNTGLWTSLKGLSGQLRSALEWYYWIGLGQVTNRQNVYFFKPTSVQSQGIVCCLLKPFIGLLAQHFGRFLSKYSCANQ
jgi:hypothetical protein